MSRDQVWENSRREQARIRDGRTQDWRTRTGGGGGGCAGTRDGKTRTGDVQRPGAGGSRT